MTFFNKLKAHVAGLVRIKTDLYWYDLRVWDHVEGRVCLLLDVLDSVPCDPEPGDHIAASTPADGLGPPVSVLLFIDSVPKCVWIHSSAVEFIK